MKAEFKYIDRGFEETVVLVHGWAADFRIFSSLEVDYNYLLPLKFSPLGFTDELLIELEKNGIDKISLLGWSMGGFLSSEFASEYPKKVDGLFLVGIREKFDPVLLDEVKIKLKRNKESFLHKFYLECFSDNDKEGISWFKNTLLKDYTAKMELNDLLTGLDYLKTARIDFKPLADLRKIKIIHGEEDKIAPISEALKIKSQLPQADFVCLKNAGHLYQPTRLNGVYNG